MSAARAPGISCFANLLHPLFLEGGLVKTPPDKTDTHSSCKFLTFKDRIFVLATQEAVGVHTARVFIISCFRGGAPGRSNRNRATFFFIIPGSSGGNFPSQGRRCRYCTQPTNQPTPPPRMEPNRRPFKGGSQYEAQRRKERERGRASEHCMLSFCEFSTPYWEKKPLLYVLRCLYLFDLSKCAKLYFSFRHILFQSHWRFGIHFARQLKHFASGSQSPSCGPCLVESIPIVPVYTVCIGLRERPMIAFACGRWLCVTVDVLIQGKRDNEKGGRTQVD